MQWSRAAAVVLLLVALGVGVTKASSRSSTFPLSTPCNAPALAAPYTGPLTVRSVDSFGCVGHWAYIWATVGTGVQEIGVTEVLHYDAARGLWRNASRVKYCNHHLLPAYVQLWGCNSN
jgi:hypothetical protein